MSSALTVRPLTLDDAEQSWRLGGLAFGYDGGGEPPQAPAGVQVGSFDDAGRLLARAMSRPYEQWWCGRAVAMAGIAGVAVHPDARGRGVVRQLMAALVSASAEPISALFPTAPGVYRRLGWEVVGTLDDTDIPVTSFPRGEVPGVFTRDITRRDLDAVHALYSARGRSGSGLLTREGPSFPDGPAGLLDSGGITTVAVADGAVVGFVHYDRGRGYRHGGPLRVWDLVTATPAAEQALLAALGSWSAVVDAVRWRGSTSTLATVLPVTLPPPAESQPWMLRVLDVAGALAGRGYLSDGAASFAVQGQGHRLEVRDGQGAVTAVPAEGVPRLTDQGLALLFAGMATRLHERGHADAPVPQLEALLRGPAPEILDYF